VVTALRRKYAELLGLGDGETIAHVGKTLLLFHPDEDLAAIAPIRPYKPDRERWTPTVLRVLMREARPMTGRELAYRVMEAHALDPQDFRRLKSIECGLHIVLGRMEGSGVVRVGQGRPKRWALASTPPDDSL
jgi:hypothetical protein